MLAGGYRLQTLGDGQFGCDPCDAVLDALWRLFVKQRCGCSDSCRCIIFIYFFTDRIPIFFSWIQKLSFFNYAFEALIVNELDDIDLAQPGVKVKIPGRVILKTFGFNPDNYWVDTASLAAMFFILLSIAYVFLRIFVRERR